MTLSAPQYAAMQPVTNASMILITDWFSPGWSVALLSQQIINFPDISG